MPPLSQVTRRNLPIVLLILLNLVAGLFTVRDFGVSWDEPGNIAYGEHSLQNFANLFRGQPVVDYNHEHLDQKGPAFFMLVVLAARAVHAVFPGVMAVNTWHFVYFLSFQMSILALYALARRWVNDWAAFGAALLFSTQPLLWGHAFINPKDVPFMAFFAASIAAGLYALDAVLGRVTAEENFVAFLKSALAGWRGLPQPAQKSWLGVSGGVILLIVALIAGKDLSNHWIERLVTQVYSADTGFASRAFHYFAQSAGNTPVSYYIEKAQAWWTGLEVVAALLVLAVIFAHMMRTSASFNAAIQTGLREFWAACRDARLLAAGILLGLTVSIRILGPLAGVIVALYALEKSFKRALPAIAALALIAALSAFVTWPYLWAAPIGHLLETVQLMSKYVWTESVLFNGIFYPPDQLPWYYLPELFTLQLTEPLLLLSVIGIFGLVTRFRGIRAMELTGMGLWLLAPLAGPILLGSTLYDNFRQFLFILPPVFLLAALGLDFILDKLKRPWFKAALLLVVALPGLWAGLKLHPYEYVYYNGLAGGASGAFRRFEMDYWATSYKDAAQILNQVAPANSRIAIYGPDELFRLYARPDLKVINVDNASPTGGKPDYFVSLTRWNNDLKSCPQGATVAEISRDGAVFTVIRKISGGGSNCP